MTKEEMQIFLDMFDERLDKKLEPINGSIENLQASVGGLQTKVGGLQATVAELQQDVKDIKQVQLNSVVSDNEIKQKLGVLLDGMKGIQDRFDRQDKTEEKVEDLQHRMSAVEYKLKQA